MTEHTEEYQKIRVNVLSNLRRRGYYRQPSVRAYHVTIQVLKDLEAQGLVFENDQYGGSERLFSATSMMISTVVVRNQFGQDLKAGNYFGHSGEFVATVNERFNEVNNKSFIKVGVVASVEVKYMPKNFWEKLIGHKTVRVVFITLADGKVIKTFYNNIYQVVRTHP